MSGGLNQSIGCLHILVQPDAPIVDAGFRVLEPSQTCVWSPQLLARG